MNRLEVVGQREVPDAEALQSARVAAEQQAAEASKLQQTAIHMMGMALKALSQRAVVALSNLFTLLTVASAFALWFVVLANITVLQIIGLSIYSTFILCINIWGRRRDK